MRDGTSRNVRPESTVSSPSTNAAAADGPPRVLLVAPQPFYSDRGTPIAVRHLLDALSQLAYEVDVLTFPVGRSLEIPGVRYFRVANPLRIRRVPIGFSFRKLWLDLFLFFALRKRLRRHSYLCVHAVEEAAYLAVVAARGRRLPVIYDMQSSIPEQMSRRFLLRSRAARRLLDACERWLVRRATVVVTSAGLAQQVRASMPESRVREWLYPGLNSELNRGEVDSLRAQLDIEPDRNVVLYAGTFESYQGLCILIEAMPAVLARAPNTTFVLVGAEGSKLSSVAQQLAERLPDGAYRLLERQPREAIPGFLALADVVVSPRLYGSNLPLKILRYLAAGRAIVATAIPAHRAILDERLAVLAEPTPAGLAAAVTRLLEDPTLAADLRAAASAYARENLDWMSFVYSVGAMYEELEPQRSNG